MAVLARQDAVVSVAQLKQHGFNSNAISRRLGTGAWQRLLPSVILTVSGTPTRRQRLVAAWLWGGPGAAVDGIDACAWHGMCAAPRSESRVHVVTPLASSARSRDFVVVRRTIADVPIGGMGLLPYVDRSTALIVAARNSGSSRNAIGLLARGLQQQQVTVGDLRDARERIGDKWCRGVDSALIAVGVGLRSPAERDAHDLIVASSILPTPRWNQWLDLGDGGCPVCADALWEDAGMASEVIGRRYHAWAEQFESTEARRARMIAAGLVMQGCTALQARHHAAMVRENLERTYLANAGRGMPPGVRLIDPPALRAAVA
jgi:hypothetical protein